MCIRDSHRAWVLLAYKIQIFKDLRFGEEVEVGTSPLNFDKVMATRQFWIKDANGGYIVKAESIWSLLDTENRMPVRITEGDISKYQLGEAFDSLKAVSYTHLILSLVRFMALLVIMVQVKQQLFSR